MISKCRVDGNISENTAHWVKNSIDLCNISRSWSFPHSVIHNISSMINHISIWMSLTNSSESILNCFPWNIARSIVGPSSCLIGRIRCKSIGSTTANRIQAVGKSTHQIVVIEVNVGDVNDFQVIVGANIWHRFWCCDWRMSWNVDGEREHVVQSSTFALKNQAADLSCSQWWTWVNDIQKRLDVHSNRATANFLWEVGDKTANCECWTFKFLLSCAITTIAHQLCKIETTCGTADDGLFWSVGVIKFNFEPVKHYAFTYV